MKGGAVVFQQNNRYERMIRLPCGGCQDCRLANVRDWAVRSVHEDQMSETSCFVTLTYDEDELPPDHGLDKTEWQLFAKKLRNKVGSFRFVMCGEYGERLRPHYHALLWGIDFDQDKLLIKDEQGLKTFKSKQLEEVWNKGLCTVQDVTWGTASYCASYVMKKAKGEEAIEQNCERVDAETGECFQVPNEFALMSTGDAKKGTRGIGYSWIKKYLGDVYPGDFVVVNGGNKFRPPRYYDKVLSEEDPSMFLAMKKKRLMRATEDQMNQTPERLAVKAELTRLRVAEKKKKL